MDKVKHKKRAELDREFLCSIETFKGSAKNCSKNWEIIAAFFIIHHYLCSYCDKCGDPKHHQHKDIAEFIVKDKQLKGNYYSTYRSLKDSRETVQYRCITVDEIFYKDAMKDYKLLMLLSKGLTDNIKSP